VLKGLQVDLSELNEMYSSDPEVRRQTTRGLPMTISRGEYEDLQAAKLELELLKKTLKTTLVKVTVSEEIY
jgi:hypothetical protein